MKFLFKIFSENLNPSLSPRYTKRYEQDDLNSPSNLITSKSLIRQWEKFAIMNKQINKKDLKEDKIKMLSPKKINSLNLNSFNRRSEQPSPKGFKKLNPFELNNLMNLSTSTRRSSDVEVRKFKSLKEIDPEGSLTPRIPSPSTPRDVKSDSDSDSDKEEDEEEEEEKKNSKQQEEKSLSKSSPNVLKKSNSFRDILDSFQL